MTWGGNRIHWAEGVCQVYNVMHNVHDGANLSDKPMEFLFVDVRLDTIVECQQTRFVSVEDKNLASLRYIKIRLQTLHTEGFLMVYYEDIEPTT